MGNTAQSIDALIAHHFHTHTSTPTTTTTRHKLRKHLLRILGSVLGSHVSSLNEQNIIQTLQNKIARHPVQGHGTISASRSALKFQELAGRVRRSGHYTKRWAIFHVLKQLSYTKNQDGVRISASITRSAREGKGGSSGSGGGGESFVPAKNRLPRTGTKQHEDSAARSSSSSSSREEEEAENAGSAGLGSVEGMIYGKNGLAYNMGEDDSALSSTLSTQREAEMVRRRRQRTVVAATLFQLAENLTPEMSEVALLRDVLYAFQGECIFAELFSISCGPFPLVIPLLTLLRIMKLFWELFF